MDGSGVKFTSTNFGGGGSGGSYTRSKSDALARERDAENLRRYEIAQARLQRQDAYAAQDRRISQGYASSRNEEAMARAGYAKDTAAHQETVRGDYTEDRDRMIAAREAGDLGLSMDPSSGTYQEEITGAVPASPERQAETERAIRQEYDTNAFIESNPEAQKQIAAIDKIKAKRDEFMTGKDYVVPGFGSGKSDAKIAEFDNAMAKKASTVNEMVNKNLESIAIAGSAEVSRQSERERVMPLKDYKNSIIDQFKLENPGVNHKSFMRSETYKTMVKEQQGAIKTQKANDTLIQMGREKNKAAIKEAAFKEGEAIAKGVTSSKKDKATAKAKKTKERKDRVIKIMKDLDISMKDAQRIESGL